jgi:Leucine-rich repeat (LRR) protein
MVAVPLALGASICLYHFKSSGREQREAGEALQKLGVRVEYEGSVHESGSSLSPTERESPILRDVFWPRIVTIDASGTMLSDADLAALPRLQHVRSLDLSITPVTDEGLVHLRFLPRLTVLKLSRNLISNRGLELLRWVPKLETLTLDGTSITDTGLVQLGCLSRLRNLNTSYTHIGDSGLRHVTALRQLECLQLRRTRTTDIGLTHLSNLQQLREIDLGETAITWKGIAKLTVLSKLTKLSVSGTQLDDSGMATLARFPSLTYIDISNTCITRDGATSLAGYCPRLHVTFEQQLTTDPDTTDEPRGRPLVTSAGDSAPRKQVSRMGRSSAGLRKAPVERATEITESDELLEAYWVVCNESLRGDVHRLRRVRWLALDMWVRASPDDLQWIGQLTQLWGLRLPGAQLEGADLSQLRQLQSLVWLDLSNAKMAGRDFQSLPPLASLETLLMDGQNVTDQFLLHLVALDLPALARLGLNETSVSDRGVEQLCRTYNLTELSLYCVGGVTGRSVGAIGQMTKLRLLQVGGSGLSPNYAQTAEVRRLMNVLPECSIIHGD